MYECAEHVQRNVQPVAEKQYQQSYEHVEHWYSDAFACVESDGVEYASEDSARHAQSEQTDVREQVAQQTRYGVVGRPKARTDVGDGILAGRGYVRQGVFPSAHGHYVGDVDAHARDDLHRTENQ